MKRLLAFCFVIMMSLTGCRSTTKTDYDQNNKKVLKIASIYETSDLTQDIADFKAYKGDKLDYTIELKTYASYDDPVKSFLVDISSGKSADIVVVPRNILYKLVNRNMVEDLYQYMDSDPDLSRGDYIQSILKAFEIKEGLYQTVSNVNLKAWVTEESEYTDPSKWSIYNFKKLIDSYPTKSVILSYSTEGIIKSMINGMLNDYIDWENGECDFNNESFYELLDLLSYVSDHSLTIYEQNQDTVPDAIKADSVLFTTGIMGDYLCAYDYSKYEELYKGKTAYLGPPVVGGSSTCFGWEMSQQFSMMKASEMKNEVWDFLRFFMSRDYQKLHPEMLTSGTDWRGFPCREDCFKDYLNRYTARSNYEYDGELVDVESDPEWITSYTEEYAKKYREIIDRTDRVDVCDDVILNIITDEVSAFLKGERDKKEAANHIQDRVKIYLAE